MATNWIEFDYAYTKQVIASRKLKVEDVSRDMGHDKSWLSGAGKRGKMTATDLKLLSMLLEVPTDELGYHEPEPVPVPENQNVDLRVVLDKLDALEAKIDALSKAVEQTSKPTKPPKTEGQQLAERILVQTMAGSRYCRYDTYIANCELRGIAAIDTTKAWKSCHCEMKKKGYGANQSNWLVVLDGYELPKID